MAILMALILTVTAVLDYLWEHFANKIENPSRIAKLKATIIWLLIAFGWILAVIQLRKDAQSDRDMDFVKGQLALANVSLTNATLTVNGMNDGGDAYAEPTFGVNETNLLTVSLFVEGQYPLRRVSVKVLNETKHIQAGTITLSSAQDTR